MEVGTIVAGIQKSQKEKDEDAQEAAEHKPTDTAHLADVKGIPDFWSTAVTNNTMMMQYFREKDRDVLKYLTNVITSETSTPNKEIRIELHWDAEKNEYFTNAKLELIVKCKKDSDDEVAETIGCLIDWKDGKDLSKKKIKKKQKNKKTGETRQIVKTVPAESFFNVFESRKAPENPEDDDDDNEDGEMEKLLDAIDESMQVAMDFNDLYNWEALEYYLNFGQAPGDFMDDMQGDDDDDDDEDKDEDAQPVKKAGKKGGQGGAGAGAGADGKEQECKQQ